MKPVAAVGGDVAVISGGGVAVNGVLLDNSAPLAEARTWPAGRYVVRQGEVWLISGYNARSFDSRYFGPVASTNIISAARPVLTATVY